MFCMRLSIYSIIEIVRNGALIHIASMFLAFSRCFFFRSFLVHSPARWLINLLNQMLDRVRKQLHIQFVDTFWQRQNHGTSKASTIKAITNSREAPAFFGVQTGEKEKRFREKEHKRSPITERLSICLIILDFSTSLRFFIVFMVSSSLRSIFIFQQIAHLYCAAKICRSSTQLFWWYEDKSASEKKTHNNLQSIQIFVRLGRVSEKKHK